MARFSFRRLAAVPGTCPSGCWTERQEDGRLICVCGDTLFKGAFTDGVKKTLAVAVILAAAVGGAVAGSAIKKRTVRGYQ